MRNIGVNIKTLRLERRLTQSMVARKLCISTAAFSKIESGITDVSISRLIEITKLFDVSILRIIDDRTRTLEDQKVINLIKQQLAERDKEIMNLKSKLLELYEVLYLPMVNKL